MNELQASPLPPSDKNGKWHCANSRVATVTQEKSTTAEGGTFGNVWPHLRTWTPSATADDMRGSWRAVSFHRGDFPHSPLWLRSEGRGSLKMRGRGKNRQRGWVLMTADLSPHLIKTSLEGIYQSRKHQKNIPYIVLFTAEFLATSWRGAQPCQRGNMAGVHTKSRSVNTR